MYLQRERVTHLGQWPPHRPRGAARRGRAAAQPVQQLSEHAFDPLPLTFEPLPLQVGQVMIELVGQRSQRPALGAADHDLADQVAGQLGRHLAHLDSRQTHDWLPCIIRNGQLSGDPGLQCLQQRGLSRRQRDRIPATERLVDLLCDLVCLHSVGRADLAHRDLHGGRNRLFQRTCLVTAAQQSSQLLITGVGQLPDQPPHQVIDDKHTSSLPRCGALDASPPHASVASHPEPLGGRLRRGRTSQRTDAQARAAHGTSPPERPHLADGHSLVTPRSRTRFAETPRYFRSARARFSETA